MWPTFLIQRFAGVEEVASLLTYIISPLSSATNGAALRVDGGVVKGIFKQQLLSGGGDASPPTGRLFRTGP